MRERTMKKAAKNRQDPDLLDEYDFGKGVRGKYAKRYAEGTNVVVISAGFLTRRGRRRRS